jgi:hypothetical protein
VSKPPNDLPPQVRAALEQGKKVEAVKLLRKATGVSLRDAMLLIETRHKPTASRTTSSQPASSRPVAGQMALTHVDRLSPDEARRIAEALGAAVKRGDWSEAIQHFGRLSGKDLGKASQTVEKLATKYRSISGNYTRSGLSPGEVPRTPLWQTWLVVIVLALLGYYLLAGG